MSVSIIILLIIIIIIGLPIHYILRYWSKLDIDVMKIPPSPTVPFSYNECNCWYKQAVCRVHSHYACAVGVGVAWERPRHCHVTGQSGLACKATCLPQYSLPKPSGVAARAKTQRCHQWSWWPYDSCLFYSECVAAPWWPDAPWDTVLCPSHQLWDMRGWGRSYLLWNRLISDTLDRHMKTSITCSKWLVWRYWKLAVILFNTRGLSLTLSLSPSLSLSLSHTVNGRANWEDSAGRHPPRPSPQARPSLV